VLVQVCRVRAHARHDGTDGAVRDHAFDPKAVDRQVESP
jgi:hypothetical protein